MKPISIPIRTVNALNAREHWRTTAKRAKKERTLAYMVTPVGLELPLIVNLTRFGKNKRPMDDDGLTASFKNIRDGIADKCNVDDGNAGITFQCRQKYANEYGIEIEFLKAARVGG